MSLTSIDLHGNMHYENVVNQTRNNFFWKKIWTKQMNSSKKAKEKIKSEHEIGARRRWKKNMKEQEKHEHEAIMRKNKNIRKEQKKENEGAVQLDEIRLDFELTTTHKINFSAKAPRRNDCFWLADDNDWSSWWYSNNLSH